MSNKTIQNKKNVILSNYRGSDNMNIKELKQTAGIIIVLIAVIEMGFLICGGGLWINQLDLDFSNYATTSTTSVEGKEFSIKLPELDVDTDELFNSTYFNVLSVLSDSVAYGTSWLPLCLDSQTEVNSKTYVEVCSQNYNSVESVKKPLEKYLTSDYIDYFVDDIYVNSAGKLYVRPVVVSKDETYVGFDSFEVKESSKKKITYIVRSKYSELNCGNKCNYVYKNHLFELVKEGNNWLVSNMEMPY